MRKIDIPTPFWFAHLHWARDAKLDGRGRGEPALLSELPLELTVAVAAEGGKPLCFGTQSGAE